MKLLKNSSASSSLAPVFERCLRQLFSSLGPSCRVVPLTSSIPSKGNEVVDKLKGFTCTQLSAIFQAICMATLANHDRQEAASMG